MRKLGRGRRGRGGWARAACPHPPPLQARPDCAPSSSLPPFPGVLQFHLGCLSCPLPPVVGATRLVVIKAFRPRLRARPRELVWGLPGRGLGVPGAGPSSCGLPVPGPVCTHAPLPRLLPAPRLGACACGLCSRTRWERQRPSRPAPRQLLLAGFLWKGPPNRAVPRGGKNGPGSELLVPLQAFAAGPPGPRSPPSPGRLGGEARRGRDRGADAKGPCDGQAWPAPRACRGPRHGPGRLWPHPKRPPRSIRPQV